MNPLTLGLMAGGAALQIFGGIASANNAKQQAQVSENIAVQEQGINNTKQEQMQVQARRMQLENVRNSQRARAQATASAVSQGSSVGTGMGSSAYLGGQDDIQNQAGFNSVGINSNLQFGNTVAAANNNISADKIQLANLGGQAATDAGISSLGGALMKDGPVIGQMAKGTGSLLPSMPGSGGGMFFNNSSFGVG